MDTSLRRWALVTGGGYPEPVTTAVHQETCHRLGCRYAVAFLAAVFFAARFLATIGVPAFFAAWKAAQRFLVASEMAFLPAALSFRFGLGASGTTGDDGTDSFLDSAHRFRWASPMRFRAAALILRLLPFGTVSYTHLRAHETRHDLV